MKFTHPDDLPPGFFTREAPITRGEVVLDLEDRSLRRVIREGIRQDAIAAGRASAYPRSK